MPFSGSALFASYTRARSRTLMLSAFWMAFASAALCAEPKALRRDVSGQLASSRSEARLQAAMDVQDHRATASADALTAAAGAEARPDIRIRMLMAAFEVDRSSALPFLVAALRRDPDSLVRAVAAQTLARFTPDASVRRAFLDGLAKDRDRDVRRACAIGLGFHHTPDAVKALSDASSDPDPELRRRVGLALTRHPKSSATERILDRLENDADPSVSGRVRGWRRGGRAPTP